MRTPTAGQMSGCPPPLATKPAGSLAYVPSGRIRSPGRHLWIEKQLIQVGDFICSSGNPAEPGIQETRESGRRPRDVEPTANNGAAPASARPLRPHARGPLGNNSKEG